MSNTVLVIGESGSGKSHSMQHLNPEETFIISILAKPLPWRGFKNTYLPSQNKALEGNYFVGDKANIINNIINTVDTSRPDIKNLIVDDFQYLMANQFMYKAMETGFQKFSEIGFNAWNVVRLLIAARKDLDCFVLSHNEIDPHGRSNIKTIGKMLTEKVSLEGMFTCIFHTAIIDGTYNFMTMNNGSTVSKTPHGMFDAPLIENNLQYVKEKMAIYYGGSNA